VSVVGGWVGVVIETAPSVGVFEVEDLDADTLLRIVRADVVREKRVAARRELRFAEQWCRLNSLDLGEREEWEGTTLHIAGAGTPWLRAGAAREFAGALGVAVQTGQALLADGLDLRFRLPRTRQGVEELRVDAWKARKLAVLTRQLPLEAARWVDAQLAGRLHKVGLPTMEDVVLAAMATWCPELVAEREQRGRAAWKVRVSHGERDGWAGTSWMDVVAATGDVLDFHHLVCAVAQALAEVGDPDPMEALKAKALGLIGRGEHAELLESAARPKDTGERDARGDEAAPDSASGVERSASGAAGRPISAALVTAPRLVPAVRPDPRGVKRRLFVHLDADQLAAAMEGEQGTAQVAGFGRVTTDLLEGWLGQSGFTITPVVDLSRDDAVDRHDPPPWMRTLVMLRDRHCVAPYCQVDAWACDLDHIEPYRPHGPPGQTRPENLACLCRGGHNAKTHEGWRYHRTPEGSYLWTSPSGLRYRVTPGKGTEQLDD
jgi:hypothetical protein